MTYPVAVAISGGIDSLYAAYLLKRDGYRVTGIHFITGYTAFSTHDAGMGIPYEGQVYGSADAATCSAMAFISRQLDIPIHIVDLSGRFEAHVVDYFAAAYQKGQTPNPCLRCNPLIKFGALMDFAQTLGIETIATGHYVKTRTDENGRIHLLKGRDPGKDQAYFLAFLTQEQLKRTLFPLGDTTKQTLREHARALGLNPVSTKESQDVCFIKDDYKTFLASRPGFKSEPGPIRTQDGHMIGTHNGLHSFTIGQRRGINCPAEFPYYVLELDTGTNSLIVGPKDALFLNRCKVRDPNWINPPQAFPATVTTRIRYAHKGTLSTLTMDDNTMIHVDFHEPVSSITPGQGAVFYDGDEVIGGGWIV